MDTYSMDIIETILSVFTHWPPNLVQVADAVQSTEPSDAPPPPVEAKPTDAQLRKWRITQYYVSDQKNHAGSQTVPVLRTDGQILGYASPSFFSSLSLEGTGLLANGKLINVSGKYVPVDADKYQPVWDYHKKYLSKRSPGYSGLMVVNDKVVKAFAYVVVTGEAAGKGYGSANGFPLDPFRTVAADIGRTPKDDPRFKGKGGLVPVGTRCYIKELDGKTVNDFVHDGWITVTDTGGGIFGAHFDLFSFEKGQIHLPDVCHIWFKGIEERVDENYILGLRDV
jgi:3D (Asp-Asp-Asp) domain-containing protein